jgi:hypothetical protein
MRKRQDNKSVCNSANQPPGKDGDNQEGELSGRVVSCGHVSDWQGGAAPGRPTPKTNKTVPQNPGLQSAR